MTSRAALTARSDAVIILVDATQGPLPINREDIILGWQFSSGPVMIGFSQSSLIDDAELLELEELEMRELLRTYGLPADRATVFFDSSNAPTKLPKGYDAIAEILSKIEAESGPPEELAATNSFEAWVYSLADLEAYERGISKTISTGSYRIIFGHIAMDAELVVTSPIPPGENGTVRVNLLEDAGTLDTTRFVIGSPAHVIAVGVAVVGVPDADDESPDVPGEK